MGIIIFGMVTFFAAALLQGLSGFGFSILAIPLITIILTPKVTVPILLMYSMIINIAVLYSSRKHIDFSRIWLLLIFGIIGVPIGTQLLIMVNENYLKLFIGILILSFGILLAKGIRKKLKHEKLGMIPVGLVSGILGGSISVSGPPLIILMANQDVDKQTFRASLALYFFLLNIFTLPVYIYNGLITEEVLSYSVTFLPGLLAGVILGNLYSHKIAEQHFRKLTLTLLIVLGLIAIFSSIRNIIILA